MKKTQFKPVLALLLLAAALAGGTLFYSYAASSQEDSGSDLLLSTYTDMANLMTYVDGELSGDLSGLCRAGETWTLTAPVVSGKTFSHWALNDPENGVVVSTQNPYQIAVYVNTTLYAVYTSGTPEQSGSRVAFTALAAADYIGSDVIRMTATYSLASGSSAGEVGVVYTSNHLLGEADPAKNLLSEDSQSDVAALLKSGGEQTRSYSGTGSGTAGDWTLFLTPPADTGYVYAAAYVVVGTDKIWSDPVAVRYSELESGVVTSANFSVGGVSLNGLEAGAEQGGE